MHEKPHGETIPNATDGLSDARRNFVGFLNDRITAPITLFQRHALRQQGALDAATQLPQILRRPSPLDATTGGFTTEAVADYHAAVNYVINSAHHDGLDSISKAYVGAYFAVKKIFDNESKRRNVIFSEMQSRWNDDPSIAPHISRDIFSSRP